jgi:predicted secreted protein
MVTFVLLYLLWWWVLWWMVLAFGNRKPGPFVPGHASSAPHRPRLGFRCIVTSLVSLVTTSATVFLLDHYHEAIELWMHPVAKF